MRVTILINIIYSFRDILRSEVFADTSKHGNLPKSIKLEDAANCQAKKELNLEIKKPNLELLHGQQFYYAVKLAIVIKNIFLVKKQLLL